MKDSKTIISHLKKNPLLQKLEQEECYKTLIELLPSSIRKFIKFIYKKNGKLFFVLNHPAGKMELDYKTDLIKSLLKKIETFNPNCSSLGVEEIVFFVSNKAIQHTQESPSSKITYEERSYGQFSNTAKDEKLYTLFEEIRKEIECLKKH
ncbi:MAG TPA: hypothetical protein CFH82_01520 [Sulfurospirillum sp. UBA12182]|jgi:hypothetical protein|nr:MAG TPA: hypothetical protein CFH82_01520 [Sulfurospirillum sp. UBA12182]